MCLLILCPGLAKKSVRIRLIDMLVFFIPVATTIVGFIVYVTSIIFCFDPLYFVLQDLLPRSASWNWVSLATRLIFTYATFEVTRTIGFIFYVFVVITDRFIQILDNILFNISKTLPTLERSHKRSLNLTLVLKRMSVAADQAVTNLYSSSFWGIVVGGWLVVNGYGMIPVHIYWLICSMGPVCIGFLFFTLIFVGNACDRSTTVTRKLRFASSVHYSVNKSQDRKNKRILMKKCKNLQPMALIYLPVSQPIGRRFARDWFQNIVDRLFDAIILF